MVIAPLSDAIILYKPSKDLLAFIMSVKCCDHKDIPEKISNICQQNTEASKSDDVFLTIEDLQWLHRIIEQRNEDADASQCIYFHQLFHGSEIILPANAVVPRSEELQRRCEKLRIQQENVRYKAMTKNVDNTRQTLPEETIAYQMKQINSQLIAIFQFIVSVLTGFAFGFIGIELLIGTFDFGFRLLLGIICALIVALAELYFLAKKLNEDVEFAYKETSITSHHHNSKVKND